MVTGRQSSGRGEPSPPPPLSCDHGQVRKVSWAGAAPRLADLSAAGEGAGAGAREEAPCFVGGLRAPRRHFCFLPGGAAAAAGVAAALGGARAAGAPGRSQLGKSGQSRAAGVGVGAGAEGAGAGDGAQGPGPGTRGEDLAGAGWWGLREDSAAGAGGLGTGERGIWGLETREAALEKGLAARTLAFLGHWQMGGNSSAGALWGGDSEGLEGWRARGGGWGGWDSRGRQ